MSMVAVYSQSKEASNESSKPIKRPSAMKPPQVGQQNPAVIIKRIQAYPESLTRDDVIQLQKTIGNRAVIKFLSGLKSNNKSSKLEEEKPIQMKKDLTAEQSEGNKTGIPNNLKSGLETLSNVDLSDVRVHRNSDRPSKMGALAYTQGSNIYVGPGQEKHLPHEGWHVVQQKQGRVKPILQMKTGIQINDDGALEKEADFMGNRAALIRTRSIPSQAYSNLKGIAQKSVIQTKSVNSEDMQKAKPKNKALNNALDILQTIIDIVGFIPVVGDIADAINVIISLLRGDLLNAALSAIAIIPVVGSAVAVPIKLIYRAAKNVKTIERATHILLKVFGNMKKVISVLDSVYKGVVGILRRIPDGISSLADKLLVRVTVGRPKIINLANEIRKGLGNVFEKVNEIVDSAKGLIKKVSHEGAEGTSKTGSTALTAYNPKFAAQQLLKDGKISLKDLGNMVPNGAANGFKPSLTIADGYKYNYTINGIKIEIKWHAPDANAAAKFPGGNSGSGWTAQIKVDGKLLGQDGNFYNKASNITHIPVGGIK